mmetsp:Transcript_118759/g.265136  ORF Transcript_118759/g.265136 Transcript_118759/m.265136 type:complete len:679 (+) Transcript_118759:78-2114(+)
MGQHQRKRPRLAYEELPAAMGSPAEGSLGLPPPPPFDVAGAPCPTSSQELQHWVLRFICGSPDFGPFPVGAVGLNGDLRRAFMAAGHSRVDLKVFRAGDTGEAVRAIHRDLCSAGWAGALSLEDTNVSDASDLLIVEADPSRIHHVLAAGTCASSTRSHRKRHRDRAMEDRPATAEVAATSAAPLAAAVAPTAPAYATVDAARNFASSVGDEEDELARLLAEPTVRRQQWGAEQGAGGASAGASAEGSATANGLAKSGSKSRSRQRRRRKHHREGEEEGDRDRRRRRRHSCEDPPEVRQEGGSGEGIVAPVQAETGSSDAAPSAPSTGMALMAPPLPGSCAPLAPPVAHNADGGVLAAVTPAPGPVLPPDTFMPSLLPGGGLPELPPGYGYFVLSEDGTLSAPIAVGPPVQGPVVVPPPPQEHRLRADERPEKLGENGSWEEARSKLGLRLIGEVCPPTTKWSYPLKDEGRRSYAGFLPRVLSLEQCRNFFEKIRDGTEWKQPVGSTGTIPRKTGWMVSRGCTCRYRYGGVEVSPEEFPPWMVELMEVAMPHCGLQNRCDWPNSCNLNLYEDGGMSVGWHSDDEQLFQGKFHDCRILSLSLGVRRRFEMRLNWPDEGERPVFRLALGDGDFLSMEGMMQKHFQHRVPREEDVKAPRINLTWRWVAKHGPRCPVGRRRR